MLEVSDELAELLDELVKVIHDRPQHAFSFADAAIRLGVTWQHGLPVERLLTDLGVAEDSEYRNEAPEYSWPLPEPLGHRLSRLRTWYAAPLDVAAGKVLALWLEERG